MHSQVSIMPIYPIANKDHMYVYSLSVNTRYEVKDHDTYIRVVYNRIKHIFNNNL